MVYSRPQHRHEAFSEVLDTTRISSLSSTLVTTLGSSPDLMLDTTLISRLSFYVLVSGWNIWLDNFVYLHQSH